MRMVRPKLDWTRADVQDACADYQQSVTLKTQAQLRDRLHQLTGVLVSQSTIAEHLAGSPRIGNIGRPTGSKNRIKSGTQTVADFIGNIDEGPVPQCTCCPVHTNRSMLQRIQQNVESISSKFYVGSGDDDELNGDIMEPEDDSSTAMQEHCAEEENRIAASAIEQPRTRIAQHRSPNIPNGFVVIRPVKSGNVSSPSRNVKFSDAVLNLPKIGPIAPPMDRSKRLKESVLSLPVEEGMIRQYRRVNMRQTPTGKMEYFRCSKCDRLNLMRKDTPRFTPKITVCNGRMMGNLRPAHHPDCQPIPSLKAMATEINRGTKAANRNSIANSEGDKNPSPERLPQSLSKGDTFSLATLPVNILQQAQSYLDQPVDGFFRQHQKLAFLKALKNVQNSIRDLNHVASGILRHSPNAFHMKPKKTRIIRSLEPGQDNVIPASSDRKPARRKQGLHNANGQASSSTEDIDVVNPSDISLDASIITDIMIR